MKSIFLAIALNALSGTGNGHAHPNPEGSINPSVSPFQIEVKREKASRQECFFAAQQQNNSYSSMEKRLNKVRGNPEAFQNQLITEIIVAQRPDQINFYRYQKQTGFDISEDLRISVMEVVRNNAEYGVSDGVLSSAIFDLVNLYEDSTRWSKENNHDNQEKKEQGYYSLLEDLDSVSKDNPSLDKSYRTLQQLFLKEWQALPAHKRTDGAAYRIMSKIKEPFYGAECGIALNNTNPNNFTLRPSL